MKVLACILALLAVTLVATALPFLPGRYDVLAVSISGIARTVGMVSLLLVPLGLAWLGYDLWWSGEGARRTRVGFVVTSLGAGSIAVFAGAVFAFGLSGAPLAFSVLAAWVLALRRGGPKMLEWGRRSRGRQTVPALAIVLVPGIVVGAQLAMARPLTSFAWKHMMDGMEPLIADIERYRATNGRYPHSLFSELIDYRPSVNCGER